MSEMDMKAIADLIQAVSFRSSLASICSMSEVLSEQSGGRLRPGSSLMEDVEELRSISGRLTRIYDNVGRKIDGLVELLYENTGIKEE